MKSIATPFPILAFLLVTAFAASAEDRGTIFDREGRALAKGSAEERVYTLGVDGTFPLGHISSGRGKSGIELSCESLLSGGRDVWLTLDLDAQDAPYDEPRYAIAIVAETAVDSELSVAEIARAVLERLADTE